MEYVDKHLKNKGVYKIINLINNKFYIGSAGGKGGFNQRWLLHKNTLNRGIHNNKHLQRSWSKYGECAFDFQIIEIVFDNKILLEREQYYLDLLKPYDKTIGYNIAKVAGSNLGLLQSKEAKERISIYQTGKIRSLETRNKISKALKGVLAGEKHRDSKLTNKQAEEIRILYNEKQYSFSELRKLFNVEQGTIHGIIYNKYYKSELYTPPTNKIFTGENAIKATLTNQQAEEIRNYYRIMKISYTDLAKKFNVSKSIIGNIIRNETYKQIS